MNYDHLPQPPEGVLDLKVPWSRISPNSRLWVILKARLTGRPQDGHNYSSYVNISEADADRLIANMKKDPRGYPSLDQESGNPVQWMERQRLYQEWLVEAYLENPFREDVNKKIEAAEQERRLNEIQEEKRQRKEEQEEREKRRQEKQQVIPAPVAPPPAPVVVEPEAPPVAPVEPPKTKPAPLRDEDLVAPNQMPSNVSRAMAKYGTALDAIGIQLSKQNSILTRNLGVLRRIEEDLGDIKFLLGQMSENYQEALDDFESEERKKELRKKIVSKLTSPFQRKQQAPKAQKPSQPKQDKPWWNFWDKPKQKEYKFSSGGFLNTPYPTMSEGGMFSGTPIPGLADGGIGVDQKSSGKIIQPGVYTNPVRGILPPGFAVIPTNRTWGKEILGIYDSQKFSQSLGEVLQKSTSSLLGAAVAAYGSVLRGLGALSGFFNRSIPGIISTVSSILGISRSAVINMFGGPAYAGVAPNERDQKYFYKSWRIFMDKNRLYFPGSPGVFGGPKEQIQIAKDILTIGAGGEGLMGMGGTNVTTPPAWIPFSKSAAGKLFYISGFGLRWGRQHKGIDLAGREGIEIITPFAGEVYRVNRGAVVGDRGAGGGYGNLVGIKHNSPKVFTFYGHLKDVASHLQVGTKVQAGEVIGTLGDTGFSTGPHLHWEIRQQEDGGQVDPVKWTHENKPSFARGGELPVEPIEMQVTPTPPVSFVYDMLTVMARDIINGDTQPKPLTSYTPQATTTATDSYLKPVVKEMTLQMPSQPSVSTTTSSSTNTFVNISRERTMVLLHQSRMMEYA